MIIIATVWKSPVNPDHVKEMIEAGADIFRVNCSHTSNEEIAAAAREVQEIIKSVGASTKLLLDLPQEKVRLGKFAKQKEMVTMDKQYRVKTADSTESVSDFIPLQLENFSNYFKVGEKLLIGDGELEFVVDEIVNETEMAGHFLQAGELCQCRSIFSPSLMDKLDHARPVLDSLDFYSSVKPEYIALSFVDRAESVTRIREEIAKRFGDAWQPKIMAKIESQAGLDNLEAIAEVADMLIVARGDLALTIDYAEIILEQKRMCEIGKKYNCPVIVATQILDSLLHSTMPSRGDIADVTNMVLDGASGMWFSQATAHSKQPGETVKVARHIVETVQNSVI